MYSNSNLNVKSEIKTAFLGYIPTNEDFREALLFALKLGKIRHIWSSVKSSYQFISYIRPNRTSRTNFNLRIWSHNSSKMKNVYLIGYRMITSYTNDIICNGKYEFLRQTKPICWLLLSNNVQKHLMLMQILAHQSYRHPSVGDDMLSTYSLKPYR